LKEQINSNIYDEDLKRIARIRLSVKVPPLILATYGGAIYAGIVNLNSQISKFILSILAMATMASFVLSFVSKNIKCPRCAKRFHVKEIEYGTGRFQNDFTRKCVNCGLPLRTKTMPSNPKIKADE